MLFNSYPFIFLFLPLTFAVYFLLTQNRLILAARMWLVVTSLFFYSYWNVRYLPLILISITFNYAVGTTLTRQTPRGTQKMILYFGVIANLLLLGYFKYSDFLISNLRYAVGSNLDLLNVVLPLGISFFTFTQIAYLVDSYRGQCKEYDFLNYVLFVTFFPHLIAGPILHHKDLMPQFDDPKKKVLNYKNLALGLFVFFIGLFKKVMFADTFAVWANEGFDKAPVLGLWQAWGTSLSYTFQLYFDFSGYIDMAIGAALLFNIRLPINFYSPYKARNIQDFWRRWHITLSTFLRDYLYVPLGGNRNGELQTYRNLFITFLLGGLWHGASWTFIFWGALHGAAIVLHRVWSRFNIKMNHVLAWFLTFNFVNLAWVFFRAKDWDDALKVLRGMFGFAGLKTPAFLGALGQVSWIKSKEVWIAAVFVLILAAKNTRQIEDSFKPNWKTLTFALFLAIISFMNLSKVSEFIYFNF